MGHTLIEEGLKPDLEKVEAITNMPEPDDKKDLWECYSVFPSSYQICLQKLHR